MVQWLKAQRRRGRTSMSLDLNERAYEVATTIDFGERGHSRSRTFPEIIANREALHPEGRRYLIKRLRALAKAQHELAAEATRRIQAQYNGLWFLYMTLRSRSGRNRRNLKFILARLSGSGG
jgi:hypothetical protein